MKTLIILGIIVFPFSRDYRHKVCIFIYWCRFDKSGSMAQLVIEICHIFIWIHMKRHSTSLGMYTNW